MAMSRCSTDLDEFSRVSINTPPLDEGRYPWTESAKKIIQSHREYHYEMMFFIDKLDKDGPEDIVIPKKPIGKIEPLLGILPKTKILSGVSLHEYLVKLIIDELPIGAITCPELKDINVTSLDEIKVYLKTGYEGISQNTVYTLLSYMKYGEYLNVAFELHQQAKWSGQLVGTFDNWLKENVGISTSFSTKLREIGKLFGGYNKLYKLNITFSELYQRRKQIGNLLSLYKEYNEFWR